MLDPQRDNAAMPIVYTNAMAAQGGAFDVALDFWYRSGEASGEPQVRIVMSWEHAAVMLRLLERVLQDYEREVGTIRDLEAIVKAQQTEQQ